MPEPILSVRNLVVEFATPDGAVHAVNGIDYDLYPGETLAIVGESGSGKSVSAMALLGLIPQPPGRIASGTAHLRGRDLLAMRRKELRAVRGREIAMVFQDPMTSLNPVLTVGAQITEALAVHEPEQSDEERRRRVIELLALVGVPDPDERIDQYPHEFSGGMRQRAMIAMSMANRPAILVADEPTTALDVTIQAQVLDVLRAAQKETQAATILITHDLGVVAELADRVAVMYAGRIVELADVETLFARPRHPYTLGLLASLPRLDLDLARLSPIPGQPPSLIDLPPGCPFHPRCRLSRGRERCRTELPPLSGTDRPGQRAACHFWDEMEGHTQALLAEVGADITSGEDQRGTAR